MTAPPIEIHDLTVSYDQKPVLWNIDVEIPEGALVGIIGPNGAGKSTLLKSVMGLLDLSSGWVKIYGDPIEQQRATVGYIPQREEVDWDFPITVRDLVLMGRYGHLGILKRPRATDRKIADEALEKVGMTAFADRQIAGVRGVGVAWLLLSRKFSRVQ